MDSLPINPNHTFLPILPEIIMFQMRPPATSSKVAFREPFVSSVGPLSLKYQGSTDVLPAREWDFRWGILVG